MADGPTNELGTEPVPDPTPAPTPDPAPVPAQLPDDHPLVKAYKATKEQLSEVKGRVKQFEDANKSEAEKLSERTEAAERERDKARQEAIRLKVAMGKGLTVAQANRLVGETEEELLADADQLLEMFQPADPPPAPPRKPVENLRGGSDPTSEDDEDDVKSIVDSIPPL